MFKSLSLIKLLLALLCVSSFDDLRSEESSTASSLEMPKDETAIKDLEPSSRKLSEKPSAKSDLKADDRVPVSPLTSRRKPPIFVPPIKLIDDVRDAYASGNAPHILIILHLAAGGGASYVELHNKTKLNLANFRFTVHSLGYEGELEFEDLPAGWSAVKEVKIASLLEIDIRAPRAVDSEANEITPNLVIHQTDLKQRKLVVGKRKLD